MKRTRNNELKINWIFECTKSLNPFKNILRLKMWEKYAIDTKMCNVKNFGVLNSAVCWMKPHNHISYSIYLNFSTCFSRPIAETTNSLRLSKLVVPIQKFRGENALLECQYELNNKSVNNNYDSSKQYRRNTYMYYSNDDDEEVLYSVKWYKDGEEFYRFVPRANPQQNSYSFDGIRVDVSLCFCIQMT